MDGEGDSTSLAKQLQLFRIKLNNNYFVLSIIVDHGSLNHDDFMKHRLDGFSKVRCIFKYQSFSFPVSSKNRS